MKFIFPQNYSLRNKFLGVLDYSTLLINLTWIYIVFNISRLFGFSLYIQLSLVIIFCLPLILFSILGVNNEKILHVIIYLVKYLSKPKLYIFYK